MDPLHIDKYFHNLYSNQVRDCCSSFSPCFSLLLFLVLLEQNCSPKKHIYNKIQIKHFINIYTINAIAPLNVGCLALLMRLRSIIMRELPLWSVQHHAASTNTFQINNLPDFNRISKLPNINVNIRILKKMFVFN